jgi:hypothetical protein
MTQTKGTCSLQIDPPPAFGKKSAEVIRCDIQAEKPDSFRQKEYTQFNESALYDRKRLKTKKKEEVDEEEAELLEKLRLHRAVKAEKAATETRMENEKKKMEIEELKKKISVLQMDLNPEKTKTKTGKALVPVKEGCAPRAEAVMGRGKMRADKLESLNRLVRSGGDVPSLLPIGTSGDGYGIYKGDICARTEVGVWRMPIWSELKHLKKGRTIKDLEEFIVKGSEEAKKGNTSGDSVEVVADGSDLYLNLRIKVST